MFQMFKKSVIGAKRILQVGFITRDFASGAELKKFITDRDGLELTVLESSAVTTASPAKNVSIFLYDLDASSEAGLDEFDRFMRQRPASIPVIVMSPAVDDEMVRWFLRLRVSDWIKTPLGPGEIVAACGRVLSQDQAGKQIVNCQTFIGARGGVGTTTVAVHAALLAAKASAPLGTTCLVDLDLVSGNCADYLDMAPGWQVDELMADPERLDARMFDIMTTLHGESLSVLSARRSFLDDAEINEEVVTRALDFASQKYGNVFIDLPRQPEKWTDAVILGSSAVHIVTDFSVPGLRTARRLADDIARRYGKDVSPRVIVNKFSKSIFGTALTPHDAKKVLGSYLSGYIAEDAKLVREAIDRGVPLTAIKSRNAVMTDLAKVLKPGPAAAGS